MMELSRELTTFLNKLKMEYGVKCISKITITCDPELYEDTNLQSVSDCRWRVVDTPPTFAHGMTLVEFIPDEL